MKYFASVLMALAFCMSALSSSASAAGRETISFPSKDGLKISADLYDFGLGPTLPVIVLFHQARWSRGEYLEIAPQLGRRGFRCLAVDLRAGSEVNGIENDTALRARAKGLPNGYVDAVQDVEASLEFAHERFPGSKVVAWGSSYSASLVIEVAGRRPELVDGVMAFSPGEYFADFGKPRDWIRSSASGIRCPVFITSAKTEQKMWSLIYRAIPGGNKVAFLPSIEGEHGSRALWREFPAHAQYWSAVWRFLREHFQD